MTKTQFADAVAIALDFERELPDDFDFLAGFGLPNYPNHIATIEQIAALIRWECIQMNGQLDPEITNQLMGALRYKVTIVPYNKEINARLISR